MADPTENEPGQATDDLTETVIASRVLHAGHYLTFRVDTIERADGSRAERDIVGHPGAVAILAVDPDNQILLVRQFRVATGRVLLEIPAGTLDIDEATGAIEDHALAAKRELEEETGYRAGTWRHVSSFWTAPGFATEYMHLWLATDLRPADGERLGPDEDEHLRLDRLPLPKAIEAVENGEIADAKSILALLWLDRQSTAEAGAAATAAPMSDDATPTSTSTSTPTPTSTPSPAPADGPSVRLTYRLGMIEYLGAMAVASRGSRGLMIFGTILTASGLFTLILGADVATWLPGLVLGPLLLSGLFVVPFTWYALRKRRALIDEPSTVVLDSTGMSFSSSFGESHLGWHLYARIRDQGGWFFFDTGAGINYLLAKRLFSPAELATFRQILAEAGFGPDGRRVRR